MRGWRTKFIFMLIVYFSGFATAIYFLAPAPQDIDESGFANSISISDKALHFDSQRFVNSFNAGMHKCIDFSKDAIHRAAGFIKVKFEEIQAQSEKNQG